MSTEDPAREEEGIDESIRRMERVCQTVTGRQAPRGGSTTYSPIPVERDPSEYVEEQISRLLELLGQAQAVSQPGAALAPAWTPPAMVCDSGSDIVVRLDLPGVPKDQIQVLTRGNVLTITGNRPAPAGQDTTVRHTECPTGPFRRTLILAGAARGAEPTAKL